VQSLHNLRNQKSPQTSFPGSDFQYILMTGFNFESDHGAESNKTKTLVLLCRRPLYNLPLLRTLIVRNLHDRIADSQRQIEIFFHYITRHNTEIHGNPRSSGFFFLSAAGIYLSFYWFFFFFFLCVFPAVAGCAEARVAGETSGLESFRARANIASGVS
jgi:hypothetical protein